MMLRKSQLCVLINLLQWNLDIGEFRYVANFLFRILIFVVRYCLFHNNLSSNLLLYILEPFHAHSHVVFSFAISSFPLMSLPLLSSPLLSFPWLSFSLLSFPLLSFLCCFLLCCFSFTIVLSLFSMFFYCVFLHSLF